MKFFKKEYYFPLTRIHKRKTKKKWMEKLFLYTSIELLRIIYNKFIEKYLNIHVIIHQQKYIIICFLSLLQKIKYYKRKYYFQYQTHKTK